MQIQTTRFGALTISEADLIHFQDGLVGFSDLKKFVLLEDPNDEIFAWLQSCDKAHIAFPILEPELFSTDYKPNMSKSDLTAIQLTKPERMRTFTIVTIPSDVTQMTANLKAPIVINAENRCAKQVVAQNDYPIKHPIFVELQKRLVQSPATEIKSHAVDWGVAVRLPTSPAAKTPEPSATT